MPECQACGSKDVAWRQGKNGKPYLVDTRRPHFCPKRAKNGAEIARSAKKGKLAPAAAMLKEMGYPDYAELLRDIPEGEPTDMVLAALKRKGRK